METLTDLRLAPSPSVQESRSTLQDKTTLTGSLLLIVSAGLYGLEEYYDVARGEDNLTIFFIHYLSPSPL